MNSNYSIELIKEEPFSKYHQLAQIWPEPFNSIMIEAVTEDVVIKDTHPHLDLGDIFLICKNEKVIGITGYFVDDGSGYRKPYNEDTETIYLRWHGIIEAERGKGISEDILEQVLQNAKKRYPNLQNLIELVPQCDYGQPLEKHFKKLGFILNGNIENYDWSEYLWQPYLLDVNKFLNNKHHMNQLPSIEQYTKKTFKIK